MRCESESWASRARDVSLLGPLYVAVAPPYHAGATDTRMSRARRVTSAKTKKMSASTPVAPPWPSLAGVVDAAYQAGSVVAGTARWLIAGTVRAAESIVAEAEQGGDAVPAAADGTPAARKPSLAARSSR